ncbi:uncharacterized protein KRP23_13125 [Phytophthora ramorum]|uniref:uncharacterized protein n=1 Tax=Phytophthora ramorum TaxID=164328 RepID=UPI0030B574D8|nr:hypothetical protein KRP23_13125 [Phytophthora ramorum]
MKIKQQRTSGATANPPTGERDLEDLLLKTQGGLVLLRDLHSRRGRQWSEVFERYGYQHPLTAANSSSDADTTKQKLSPPQWLETLISDLLLLNEQVAATAHCAVNRSPVAANRGSVAAQALPVLVKQHAVSLETHHRLQHAKQLSPAAVDGLVHVEDVNFLMQFKYMQNQQAVVLERFCVRLKWLPVSHRFHLRQRMLALVHQQKVKNTPRPSATTVCQNSKDHLHCPLFIMTASHFAAELKSLAQKYSLPIPDMADSKTSAGEYVPLKQHAEALLASAVGAFPPDDAINTEGRLELGVETLVHAYTRNSRWELIQRGYLGNCEPNEEQSEDSLVALRNSHKIDSLLANEWELLGLDDVGYLRVRLEALSRAHMDRAKVDVAKPEPAVVGDSMLLGRRVQSMQASGDTADDGESGDLPFTKRKVDAPHTWNSDAIYVLYLLRMSSCRAKRLSLLRLLNYLHFIQLSQSPVHNITASSRPVSAAAPTPWTVTKCEKTGDYIVKRQESSEKKEDVDDEDCDDSSRDHEFFFAAARRDLEVLELQMLRIASIFLFKQEYESLPTSSRKHSDDQYYRSGHDSDTAVATIDRLQVLRDIYDCEVAFQQAKVQLVEQLLDSGLRYAPRHQDFSELGFSTAPQAQTEPFAEILFPLLQRRPLIDFSHAYFFESYAAETILLELQASLIQQMEQYFQRLEWCAHQEFAVGDRDRVEDEQGQWVCRQVLGTNALTRLYSQQRELVRKADEKWFTATSISEFHALQHALLEQTLVAWALIIKLELPGRPVRCLERTAGDLLGGSGWQLVLPPQLLADVCRTLHNESTTATKAERPQGSSSRSLIEWLAEALELENWRRELARSVYEAHLLERVHHFQFGFVKQASAFDTVIGGEQARHLTFYFDFGECDRAKALQPVAVELQSPMFHATNATPASKHAALRSDDSQSVSEWLQAQLRGLQSRSAALDEKSRSDDAATPADHSPTWRRSLLVLQQQYAAHLEVIVSYQDAVGADVFDFAASYPYVCLANSFAPESSSSSDQNSTLAMDISTVRSKFSPEAVVVIGDLFDTHPEQLQSQHYASLMRRELCKALQDTNAHLVRVLRCTTTFALLQTYQKNAGLRIRRRRQLLVTFQSSLEFVAAEATASPHHLRKQQPAEYRLSNREEQMRRLVLVAEQALFAEARPRDREREWLAFIDAVGRYEPRDSAYIAALMHLLDLHRVFIDENCQAFLRLDDEPTSSSIAIQYLAEKQALTALEDLWERFHLPAWDSLLGDQVSSNSGRSAAVVGGENLHMKKRLLGNGDLGIGTSSPSDASPFSSPKDLSYALRSLQMGATTALAQFCTSGLLVLPPPGNVDDQLVYLQISIELTWVNADMKELEDQYSKFLFHRKRHREYQRSPNVAAQKSPKRPGTSCTMSSSLLLGLNKYFHQEGIPVDNAARPDPSMTREDVESKKQEAAPAFVVPATEMARFLHDVIAQCVTHNNQQLDLHATFMRQLHDECQTAALDREKIEKQWAKAKLEERIRREAFAVDHAFHLYFEVEALRKQLSVMEARKELDQQDLRCELNAEYDEKLHKMHVELLNKQQKFAEYRTTMQRELQTVIQESHSQFVDQLLDYSGAIPSATKTSVSTLLRGQQDIVRTKSENAAMKQALLKVKALGDMQQQTQNAARDRELLLTRRYATAEALQRNEVEHLQTYVKQLEGNLSRLSQEKTYFQVKWTTAQKQMEATAQRRREAKIRALSASHTRTSTAPGAKSPDDDGFAANFTRQVQRMLQESRSFSGWKQNTSTRPGTTRMKSVDCSSKLREKYTRKGPLPSSLRNCANTSRQSSPMTGYLSLKTPKRQERRMEKQCPAK